MKTFVKKYIGKGTVNQFAIVKATVPVSQIMEHKYEKGGIEYITFEIAPLREPDHFQRTHTLYVNVAEETSVEATMQEPPAPEFPAPKTPKNRKAAAAN